MKLGLHFVVGMMAGSALAQGAPPALESIRASAGYNAAVLKMYERYESSLSTHCQTVEITGKQPPRLLTAFQVNDKGEILNGAWREIEDGTACGQKRRFNALVTVREGKPLVVPEFPGESYAGARLQQDSLPYVNVAAQAGTGCSAEVVDTHLAGKAPVNSGGTSTPWDETWDVRSCGKLYTVTLHFKPDATGTTITASPGETVKR